MAKKPAKKSAPKAAAKKAAPAKEQTAAQASEQAAVENNQGGAQQVPRQLVMHAQYVKDLSFENPNAAEVLAQNAGQPNVDVGVNVNAVKLNDEQFEVALRLTADAKADEKQLFLVELTYAGVVSVQGANEQEINPMVMIEGPRLLFPFARAVIANITREGGFLPLNIQPIDFVAVYRANIAAQQQQAAQNGQTPQ
jgi:preprotein translocase subunit SecB